MSAKMLVRDLARLDRYGARGVVRAPWAAGRPGPVRPGRGAVHRESRNGR
jgi:hypothetical protein